MTDPTLPFEPLSQPIAREIWHLKYRLHSADGTVIDQTFDDTLRRVAVAAASPEKGGARARARWADRFHAAMADLGFLPGGRILAGAGTGRAVTLFNCFVMGPIGDDLGSIFDNVKEAALTMQQGGGIGHDFSTLRPEGALVRSIGADASGPVSFMDVWDAMCRTIMSAGSRRGAMMATMACDHPDILKFVDAKRDPARLRNFNVSVLISDAFMEAVAGDREWELKFGGEVWQTIPARELWQRIMRATYDCAEPGVIFIDRINARNNLAYCEEIRATNPCGEQPLPPYGACLLGSINLVRFVERPFTPDAALDLAAIEERVATAVRLLDNVIDISRYPLPAQRHEARSKRRIGLGVTGLADALAMIGARYGSEEAARLAGGWMSVIQNAAYRTSAALAREKGAFPLYDAERFLSAPNVAALDGNVRAALRDNGIRNGCLTSIAPTGTISLLAGNVSSGVEPIFDLIAARRVLGDDGTARTVTVEDYAHAHFRRLNGPGVALPPSFVTTAELTPEEHLRMAAALQPFVDSAISKTINCPADMAFQSFSDVYQRAFELGLKGCTTFRPNPVTGAVLAPVSPERSAAVETPSARPAQKEQAIGGEQEDRSMTPPAGRAPLRLPAAAGRQGDIVYMSRPLAREPVLSGYTYKLRWPGSDHAIYVTINDIEVPVAQGGSASGGQQQQKRRRPFEIFINTRNLEHYAWTVALTRMISAVFRRGGDVSFVAEELKAVFDPQGGRWIEGRYVPSLLAAIGEVIEAHLERIGMKEAAEEDAAPEVGKIEAAHPGATRARGGTARTSGGHSCPRCSARELVREEGCWVCRACGFSRCG